MEKKQEWKKLIKKLQLEETTQIDEQRLLKEIKKRYRPHKNENYLYDSTELEQEYLIASWNALYRAKMNIGDPMAFAINRGRGAMLDYYRRINSQRLILICDDCGCKVTYDRRNNKCRNCGCIELTSMEKECYYDNISAGIAAESLSCRDDFVDRIEMESIFIQLVEFLVAMEDIGQEDKKMAIEAINYRVDFAEYARSLGKNNYWSKLFKDRIVNWLSPLRESLFTY